MLLSRKRDPLLDLSPSAGPHKRQRGMNYNGTNNDNNNNDVAPWMNSERQLHQPNRVHQAVRRKRRLETDMAGAGAGPSPPGLRDGSCGDRKRRRLHAMHLSSSSSLTCNQASLSFKRQPRGIKQQAATTPPSRGFHLPAPSLSPGHKQKISYVYRAPECTPERTPIASPPSSPSSSSSQPVTMQLQGYPVTGPFGANAQWLSDAASCLKKSGLLNSGPLGPTNQSFLGGDVTTTTNLRFPPGQHEWPVERLALVPYVPPVSYDNRYESMEEEKQSWHEEEANDIMMGHDGRD